MRGLRKQIIKVRWHRTRENEVKNRKQARGWMNNAYMRKAYSLNLPFIITFHFFYVFTHLLHREIQNTMRMTAEKTFFFGHTIPSQHHIVKIIPYRKYVNEAAREEEGKRIFSLTSPKSTIDWRDHKFFGSEVRVIYSEGCERELSYLIFCRMRKVG